MSGNNKEIPGFYRDPVTGKYYRDVPGSSSNPALKKLKIDRKVNEEFKIEPKITNAIRYLNAREIRTIGGVQDRKEYLKMRWYLKQQIQSTALNELRLNFNFTSVDYIKGSNDSIYGFWNYEKHQKYIIGTMKFKDPFHDSLYFHKAFGFVIDMCEGINDDFIVVYNSSCHSGILVECVDEYDRAPMLQYGQYFAGRSLEYSKKEIFCCCCNKSRLWYAFGCENVVGFIDAYNREEYIKIGGRVHTVVFDDTGNLMASGVHTGKLSVHDLRTKEMVMNIQISETCLVEASMLNSHHIIVSGANDVLCSVDIRKKEVVTEFLTHKQQGIKKEPLSVANNMLCALGSDNRIRIWDLSGGFPIHKIAPLENPQNKIKGWLNMSSIDNNTYLYYFEGAVKKVFQIM